LKYLGRISTEEDLLGVTAMPTQWSPVVTAAMTNLFIFGKLIEKRWKHRTEILDRFL